MSTYDDDKDPMRVAAGLKAAAHNPAFKEGARENARERLAEMGVDENQPRSSVAAREPEEQESVPNTGRGRATRGNRAGADEELQDEY